MEQHDIIWLGITIMTVLPCLTLIWMAVRQPFVLDGLIKAATGYRAPLTDLPPAWFMTSRLWRLMVMTLALIGLGIMVYGMTVQLLAWAPYDWRGDDGEWIAKTVSRGAFLVLYVPSLMLLNRLWHDRMEVVRSAERDEVLERHLRALAWVDCSGDAISTESHLRLEKRLEQDFRAGVMSGEMAEYLLVISEKLRCPIEAHD